MKASTFWKIMLGLVAFVAMLIWAPLVIVLFVSKTIDVTLAHLIEKLASNPLSLYLARKRDDALDKEQTTTKPKEENDELLSSL